MSNAVSIPHYLSHPDRWKLIAQVEYPIGLRIDMLSILLDHARVWRIALTGMSVREVYAKVGLQ